MMDNTVEVPQRSPHGLRFEMLRFAALAILAGNLVLGADRGALIQSAVVIAYLTVSVASAVTLFRGFSRGWMRVGSVALDGLAVALVLYAQLLQAPVDHIHSLTTTGLVVAFVLLNHVGLTADRKLVLLYSLIVILSWLAFLAAMAFRHEGFRPGAAAEAFFNRDLGLAASFSFTAFAVYVVAQDHGRSREAAEISLRRRDNLARFFSPKVVSQIEDGSPALRLVRRRAAIMFVDLRGFTAFAEQATSRELTYVLTRYRAIATSVVTRYGGTVDKYIGDGVMAVFGHVSSAPDDIDRALACSIELVSALAEWKRTSDVNGLPALRAGIGLHAGTVMGGILDAGGHSEFTVVGDAVNVAQRLQSVAKAFRASLVVSSEVFARLSSNPPDIAWRHAADVEIPGRSLRLDVAYLLHTADHQQTMATQQGDR